MVNFDCLHAVITLAKSEQIKTRGTLKKKLHAIGYRNAEIDEALLFWRQYEDGKFTQDLPTDGQNPHDTRDETA